MPRDQKFIKSTQLQLVASLKYVPNKFHKSTDSISHLVLFVIIVASISCLHLVDFVFHFIICIRKPLALKLLLDQGR